MRNSIGKILFACFVVGVSAYGITVLRGPRQASESQRKIEKLEKENEALQREIEAKRSYLNRLQKNPDELELEIKRRLMLVNPGSKSFILQEGAKPDAAEPTDGAARP